MLAEAAQAPMVFPPSTSQFATPPPAPVVTVNRTVPNVEPPSTEVQFSANPTDEEIARARVFEAPIITVGKVTDSNENGDLAIALLAYYNRTDADDGTAIEGFLLTHPNSPRSLSLMVNLATHYRETSQFSKALDIWQRVWASGKNVTDLNGEQIVDKAVGDWATFLVTLGRAEDIRALLHQLSGRQLHGATAVTIADAEDALWQMDHQPEKAFKCGPYSISRIQATLDPSAPTHKLIFAEESTTNGTSLYQNWLLAQKMDLKYQMAKRQLGANIPLPVMVHWKLGHFSAITKLVDGRYMIEDPTFSQGWISPKILDAESDGYFLIPDGPLPVGWSPVSEAEGKTIFGRATPTSGDGGGGGDGCSGPPGGGGYEGSGQPCPRMAQYIFNMMRIGLEVADVPIGYTPPRGPEIEFRITYSERTLYESGPFTHSNLGNQWTFEWLKYVSDDTTQPNANIQVIDSAGTSEAYVGYNPVTQMYAVEEYSQSQMTRTSGTSYQCLYPDGSMEIYSQPDVASGPRHVFLTQQIDPQGNALTFTYDSTNRLVSVTDAIGQVTTLSYGSTNDIYKITKVTDPFGRYAIFQYNSSGQLTNDIDESGIFSTFAYGNAGGEADFINSLTTPYGTTTFTNNFQSTTDYSGRWLLATDPLGGQERAEFTQNPVPSLIGEDPANLVPGGLNATGLNHELPWCMSFFWNKATMEAMNGTIDYTKARQYVWCRTTADFLVMGRTLESLKQPMENARVWYNYPGQTRTDQEGTINKPSIIARVLDDGTTQSQQYQYNAIGKPTEAIDPSGRTTYFTYATNNIDLLSVGQLAAGVTNTLAIYTYNSEHLPLTAVDAAGQTNYFGYNVNGQLIALTNALNNIVLLIYSTNGYLTNIVAGTANSSLSTNSFTYDGYGRVRTMMDPLGYTITTSYDILDRPTNITYMDGTYEQIVYNYLDRTLMRDRDGHWTEQIHDSLRHLTDVYDFIGRHTQLGWCTCGALESITDPNGNVTQLQRDIQNRLTGKIYPNLTQINYTYETNSSRLLSIADPKAQSTSYSYYVDNDVKQVSYNNAAISTPSVSFSYDTNYNRITSMVDGTGTNTYSYYSVANGQLGAGMLSSISNSFVGSYVTYNYDTLGRITNRAINNVAEQLTYDALGRVTVITNVLGTFTNTYVGGTLLISTNFAPFGKETVFTYYSITNDERLQTIWNQATNGATLSEFNYIYDPVGQITNWTSQADTASTNVQVITYDPVDQLLSDTVHSNTVAGAILNQYAYGYDAAGNRTSEQISSGSTGPVDMSQSSYNNNNQVTSRTVSTGEMQFAGDLSKQATVSVNGNAATVSHFTTNFTAYASVSSGTNTVPVIARDYDGNSATNKYQVIVTNNGAAETISYDADGNVINTVTTTSTNSYQWDAANRLVSITGPTNQSLFTYDGYGRRVQIIEETNGVAYVTNKYVWCGLQIREQKNNIGSTVTRRFFDEGEQISGTNYFFTKDQLGSIHEMVNGVGAVQARYSYDPYGRQTLISGTMHADFGFAGMYIHQPSGLNLTFLRAFNADLGRWLNRDPVAEISGLNLYDYVLNNPVNWLDPYGACGGGGSGNSQVAGGAGGGRNWGEFWEGIGHVVEGVGILGASLLGDVATGGAATPLSAIGAVEGFLTLTQGIVQAVGGASDNLDQSQQNAIDLWPGSIGELVGLTYGKEGEEIGGLADSGFGFGTALNDVNKFGGLEKNLTYYQNLIDTGNGIYEFCQ
jgi:RHS repeat-associated protein